LILVLAAGWAVPASGATTGKVKVVVRYSGADGEKHPLEGVEVIVEYTYGQPQVACTNGKGVAVFRFESGYQLRARVGPSLNEPRCDNADLRNPDNGKKMLAVNYDGHRGVSVFDVFEVEPGATTKIKLIVKTPKAQGRVCGGMWTTIGEGTAGADIIVGTADADVINARGGNDVVRGRGGNDLICGAAGRDELRGNAGNDLLFGEGADDVLVGGKHMDITVGGLGDDRCIAENRLECER
jgi:Ca2+-binding RTX toxin-like protein